MRHYYKTIKVAVVISWALLFALFWSNLSLASTVVEPARLLLMAKPGERVTGTIKVTNPSDKEADVTAVIYDWTLNEKERMITSEVGTRRDTLKGLIKFNPQNFKLAPGESQIVRFTMTAPKEGELIERRGIVFFEEKTSYVDQSGIGANVITQVGATIYLSLEGMRMAFGIDKTYIEKSTDKKYQGIIEITNQGVGHVRYRLSYKLINEKKVLINETQIPEKVILPGFKKRLSFALPEKIVPGKYNLLLTIQFLGTSKVANRTIPFTVE